MERKRLDMDLVDKYLNEATFTKLRLKRDYPGSYSAVIGRIRVSVYQAENKQYWSSTVEIGTYGDDDYSEEILQGSTKAEVVKDIEKYIKENLNAINRKPKRY
jgi:hypothetical protein